MELTNINEIKELLSRHGFRFSKSMGQNFLTAAWVPRDIADSAELDEGTGVLEVGPGIGCLTKQLSLRAGKVLSVELDNALRPILAETLSECGNVEVIFGDVLKQDLPALVKERRRNGAGNLFGENGNGKQNGGNAHAAMRATLTRSS